MKNFFRKIKIKCVGVFGVFGVFGAVRGKCVGDVGVFGGKLKAFASWCWATMLRRIVVSAFFAVLIAAPIFVFLFVPKTQAAWWNDQWLYRKSIAVANSSGGVLTDFQIKILDNKDLSADITVGKIQASLNDLRFTDINGDSIPYWIEDPTAASVDVWIKMKTIPTSGATVYMYYGNASASAFSSAAGFTTGGIITNIAGYRVHTFTSGTSAFNSATSGNVEVLVVGGGGGGGTSAASGGGAGGGGAGGLTYNAAFTVTANQALTATVGNGGNPGSIGLNQPGVIGGNSVFASITAFGGGFGAQQGVNGGSGGSGGGGGYNGYSTVRNGGSGTAGQGNAGGNTTLLAWAGGAGGGGAGGVGGDNVINHGGGSGGAGLTYSISGSSVTYAAGGKGGGGAAGSASPANVGKGGDAAYSTGTAYAGGSGVVIVRYAIGSTTTAAPATEEKGPGPVGYWKFDDGFGTNAQDSSSNNYDGTLGSAFGTDAAVPAWATEEKCVSGKCLSFDGATTAVDLGDYDDLKTLQFGTNNWTFSTWIKPIPTATKRVIFGLRTGSDHDFMIGIDTDEKPYFEWVDYPAHAAYTTTKSPNTVNDNKWHHLEVKREGSSIMLYVDSKLMATDATVGTSSITGNQWFSRWSIGAKFNGCCGTVDQGTWQSFFKGFIDEPKIFPYARTKAQIQQDYNAGLAGISASEGSSASFGDGSDKWMNDGLVGWWKMDEASWNGTAGEVKDASGNGNNGTAVNGVTTGAGKFGSGGSFDGSNDYVDTGTKFPTITAAISISLWVKPSATQSSYNDIFGNHQDNYRGMVMQQNATNTNSYSFVYGNGTSWGNNSGTVLLTANVWQNIVAIKDATSCYIYVNGVQATKGNCSDAIAPATGSNFMFGNGYNGAVRPFNGSIDETRIYNRALSPAEIKKLYDWAPGPVGHWKLDENTGATANDSSGNNNNGTLTNGPTWTQGKIGGGINFDGTNDFTQITNNASLQPRMVTVSAWIKPTGTHQDAGRIIEKGWGASPTYASYILRWGQGGLINNIYFDIGVSGTYVSAYTSTNNFNDKWTYVVGTYDGANIRIYVNGVLESTVAETREIVYTNTDLFFARYNGGLANNFQGSLDDVRIYNYARTPEQIMQDMGGSVASSDYQSSKEATAYFKFDEGNGTTANNSGTSGSTLNGTLTNMAAPATATSGWTDLGKAGKGLNFDGTDDYVNLGSMSNINGVSQLTISGWVKRTSGYGAIFFKEETATKWIEAVFHNSGNVYFLIDGTNSSGSITIPSGTDWKHYVFVFDGTQTGNANRMKIYLNGVKQNVTFTGTIPAVTSSPTANANIGRDMWNSATLNGTIDEVKIFPYALSDDDVRTEYNRGNAVNMASSGPLTIGGGSSTSARAEYCPPGNIEGNCASGQNPSPIAQWNLDEGTGTSAKDTSGNNNNGTLTNGPTWTQGKMGNAVNFDGVDDYVLGSSNLGISGDVAFTMCAWIKWTGASWSSNFPSFMGNNATGAVNQGLSFTVSQGRPAIDFWSNRWRATSALNLNTWYYVCGVKTPGVISTTSKIYVNGVFVSGAVEGTDGIPNVVNAVSILGRLDATRWFQGVIDQARIYNYARTPAQIAYDYNRGGPVGWWKMDECQGTTINDASGKGNNGTLTVGATGTQTAAGTCTTASTAWGNGATGKFNSTMSFDGTDDWLDLPATLGYSSAVSAFAWFKSTGTPGGGYHIVFGGQELEISIPSSTGQIRTGVFTTARYVANYGSGLTDGNWHHLGLVFDGSNKYSYLDGKMVGQQATTGTLTSTVPSRAIGRFGSDGTYKANGKIDDARIYNYALTKEQVANLYNGGASLKFGN